MKRALVIIIDGVGVGELPDAANYGDNGSDTLGNLAKAVKGLHLPNLNKLGLGCIHEIYGLTCPEGVLGNFGRMAERSPGKDSTTGHWELGGLILDKPFPTYPNGFPADIIQEFTEQTGLGVIGNIPASGTEIIKQLGEKHIATGKPIIYTSADSVFQIAAHTDVIPLEKLYQICKIARKILRGEHNVARVIARPFTGDDQSSFIRTKYRRDFSLKPPGKTIFNLLQEYDMPTVGIGKINELYAYEGIDINITTKTNQEGMTAVVKALREYHSGYIMANLVDFDMLWGHRNDIDGFNAGLTEFDSWLGKLQPELKQEDMLIITSDHGNDPTTPSTDHSREYVPILIYGEKLKTGINIGTRNTFADMHATLADYFNIPQNNCGESFLPLITST